MSVQISPGFLRYYRRERLELTCRLITPLFLGNARQETEWRAAPFKALLRYWWRVAQGNNESHQALLKKEGEIFGAAGEEEEKNKKEKKGKSLVDLRITGETGTSKNPLGNSMAKIFHPELQKPADKKILPLCYLAGIGLMRPEGQVTRTYFPAGAIFRLTLDFPSHLQEELKPTLALVAAFGALGARCRNGWGSFQIENGLPWNKEELGECLIGCSRNWRDGFAKDYPNCLGLDENKPLLWKTKPYNSWDGAMRELAEVYIAIRAGRSPKDTMKAIPKLGPGPGFAERHLLGVPLTNHKVNIERHASPLRFVIRKQESGFFGFVLHLPFSFANAPSPFDKSRQIQIWQKVHQGLDNLLDLVDRTASYGECL